LVKGELISLNKREVNFTSEGDLLLVNYRDLFVLKA